MTTKIVTMVDALGNLLRFVLLPGQRHVEGIAFDAILGDRAFDVVWLRVEPNKRGACAVIPRNPTGKPASTTAGRCIAGGIPRSFAR